MMARLIAFCESTVDGNLLLFVIVPQDTKARALGRLRLKRQAFVGQMACRITKFGYLISERETKIWRAK
jgi:hypothetical protein